VWDEPGFKKEVFSEKERDNYYKILDRFHYYSDGIGNPLQEDFKFHVTKKFKLSNNKFDGSITNINIYYKGEKIKIEYCKLHKRFTNDYIRYTESKKGLFKELMFNLKLFG
jgi:hypothetical protein